ncbi:LysR family transcriptional regulator [Actinobacillus equuli]|nr:LysR family transcriptional regulator [Actinobacillus equuli]
MLVATPAFLAKFGTPNSLEELQHFPLAGYGENGRLRLEKMFLQQNIELPAYFVSNDFKRFWNMHCMIVLSAFCPLIV